MPATENNKKMRYSGPKHTFPLAYALAAFSAIWVLALFAGIKFSSLDDPVISFLVRHSAENITLYQQKWLVKILHMLSASAPSVNWWARLNILGISSGVAAGCYVVSQKAHGAVPLIFAFFSVFLSYVFALRAISYTCSALIAFCGGISLVMNSVWAEDKGGKTGYIIGIFLMLLAFGMRKEAGAIGLGYLAVLGILSLDFSALPLKKEFYANNKRIIFLLLIPAVLCLGSVAANRLSFTEPEEEYNSYNVVSTDIRDYPATYPSWESGEESYSSLGLSPNDYDLLFNRWVFDDPEVFSRDRLEEIGSLKFSQTPLKTFLFMPFDAFRGMIREPSLAVLLALGLAVSFFTLLKKNVRPREVIVLWIFELCYYLYIVWNGRIVTHVLFSILWGLDICLALISCSDPAPKRKNGPECQDNGNTEKADIGHARFYPAAILLAAAVAAAGIKVSGNALQTVNNDYGTTENANRAFYDVLDSRREDTFILAPNLNKHSSRAYGPWSPFPEKYCENVFYLGGWQARAGYMVENLRSRGIENPMRALLEGEKVYSMIDENTPCILTFLREHYDACASYSIVELIGAEQMIRYCGVLGEADIALPETISERHTASCNMTAGTPMVLISGELTKNEKLESISEVYCTLQAGDHEYSYVLAYDGNTSFSGCPIVVDGNEAEPDLTTLRILVKTSAGELLEVPEAA